MLLDSTSVTDEALTVSDIHRQAKNALARGFRGYVWVTGEIKSIREHRGSWYITLVEPGQFADGGDVSLDVACWPKRRAVIQARLAAAGLSLVAGMEVRMYGMVTLSKVGRLHVDMHNLDVEGMAGRQLMEKRKLYETLRKEGLLERNGLLNVPTVPLRVGLVTSEGSEGFRDFVGQLERSGYAFSVSLAHAPVQGPSAPTLLARAIAGFLDTDVDVVAVVRGGGGELEAFDKEPVARAIASSPIPVWTGIGHTGDRSVADDVAHAAFITPTECGQALVHAVSTYLSQADDLVRRVGALAYRRIDRDDGRLSSLRAHMGRSVRTCLAKTSTDLYSAADRARRLADRDLALASAALTGLRKDTLRAAAIVTTEAERSLQRDAKALISATQRRLERAESDGRLRRAQVTPLDPVLQLRRGFSLTKTADGKIVRNAAEVELGDELTTVFGRGHARSTVVSVDPAIEEKS